MNTQPQATDVELEQEQQKKEEETHWGSQLRAIRTARKMTLEDIASELNLDIKMIEVIESEDVANLPEAPFVKGYLRNYARLLEVDYRPIIEAYGHVCGQDAPGLERVNKIRETTSQDSLPRTATWIVVAVIVISFVIWWWSAILGPKSDVSTAIPSEETQPQAQDVPGINTQVIVDGAEVAAAQQATIRLQFEKDSWVEITDANGESVFTNTGKAGQVRVLEGVPPFKVLIGQSDSVIVEYNGELFDHRVFENDGVARFTLDE